MTNAMPKFEPNGLTGAVIAKPSAVEPVAVSTALARAVSKLSAVSIDGAAADARRLMAHVLNVGSGQLIVQPERSLSTAELSRFEDAISRRLAREPVSRIEGHRGFYGRSFVVTPDVLDPRADSETLIEMTRAIVRPAFDEADNPACVSSNAVRILDIGTGSGCLLLTLLAEWPSATGTGLDVSNAALAVARRNATTLCLDERADFAIGDYRLDLPAGFGVWVANPPYIPAAQISALEPEVRDFDPRLALDGGRDGLDAYRAILSQAAAQTKNTPAGGPSWILFEAGAGQADAIIEIAETVLRDRLAAVHTANDLGGHTRCVVLKLCR